MSVRIIKKQFTRKPGCPHNIPVQAGYEVTPAFIITLLIISDFQDSDNL